MARVICPEPGFQLTLQSWTCPVWTPAPPAYVIADGPHRIISTAGHILGQPYLPLDRTRQDG